MGAYVTDFEDTEFPKNNIKRKFFITKMIERKKK